MCRACGKYRSSQCGRFHLVLTRCSQREKVRKKTHEKLQEGWIRVNRKVLCKRIFRCALWNRWLEWTDTARTRNASMLLRGGSGALGATGRRRASSTAL